MDQRRANEFHKMVVGTTVGRWLIGELIGFGGSATVFSARCGLEEAAVKIIDPNLVAEFGENSQIERISLEGTLAGHDHPHLVKIFEATQCSTSGLLFVAMENLPFKTLSSVICDVPPDAVGELIEQVASAAHWLHERRICHRDIKPDNVMVSNDFKRAVLMDLGIISPFDANSDAMADPSGERFIGTARYCPAEFVRKSFTRNDEGYAAITYYQLGALLYDMIMRRRLFEEVRGPYAVLLDAIDTKIPVLESNDVSTHLVHLGRDCLSKTPSERLSLVDWARFRAEPPNRSESARTRVDATISREIVSNNKLGLPIVITRDELRRLGRQLRTQILTACGDNQALIRPSVDIEVDATVVRVISEFEPAPDRDILRGFVVVFEVSGVSQRPGIFVVDASVLWSHHVHDSASPRSRVGIIRSPEDSLTFELEDFIYRVMAAAMAQPIGASDTALRMD